MKQKESILLLIFLFFSAANGLNAESVFYVYKDRKGDTVMQDHIPPELKYRGYKIVNANGVTLKVVPPTKRERPQKKSRLDLSKLPSSDILLLRSYSSVHDIKAARDNKVSQIQEIINSTIAHVEAFERNLSDMRAQKDKLKKDQQLVPPKLLADMKTVEGQIAESRAYISRKEAERNSIREQYERDIKRFTQLQSHAME